jgi:hypothetical protein
MSPGSSETTQLYFSKGQITAASLAGTPVGGCWLVAHNYRLLGRKRAAIITFFSGILGAFLMLTILSATGLPKHFPAIIIPLFYTALIKETYSMSQNAHVELLKNQGTQRQSNWKVAWIIALSSAIFGMIILIVAALFVFLKIPMGLIWPS